MTSSLVQELRVPQRKVLRHFAWHIESPHVKPLTTTSKRQPFHLLPILYTIIILWPNPTLHMVATTAWKH